MARIAGRQGRMLVAVASGGEAALIPFVASWSLAAAADRYEGTAQGDTNKVYVAGLSDASGDFSGYLDVATAQTYTAAVDGQPRKMYLYPDFVGTPTQYWFGTAYFDFNVESPVDGIATVSGTWAAASAIAKVG